MTFPIAPILQTYTNQTVISEMQDIIYTLEVYQLQHYGSKNWLVHWKNVPLFNKQRIFTLILVACYVFMEISVENWNKHRINLFCPKYEGDKILRTLIYCPIMTNFSRKLQKINYCNFFSPHVDGIQKINIPHCRSCPRFLSRIYRSGSGVVGATRKKSNFACVYMGNIGQYDSGEWCGPRAYGLYVTPFLLED
jgi:hypothetical protein